MFYSEMLVNIDRFGRFQLSDTEKERERERERERWRVAIERIDGHTERYVRLVRREFVFLSARLTRSLLRKRSLRERFGPVLTFYGVRVQYSHTFRTV